MKTICTTLTFVGLTFLLSFVSPVYSQTIGYTFAWDLPTDWTSLKGPFVGICLNTRSSSVTTRVRQECRYNEDFILTSLFFNWTGQTEPIFVSVNTVRKDANNVIIEESELAEVQGSPGVHEIMLPVPPPMVLSNPRNFRKINP
jgi:hypothetical protein